MKQIKCFENEMKDFWTLIFLCIGTILVIIFIPADIGVFSYFRYIISIFFTLYLPGYTLVRLIVMPHNEIGLLELFGFSIIFSLVIDFFVGWVLYYIWELSLNLIVISLVTLTFVFLILSQYHRTKFRTVDADL